MNGVNQPGKTYSPPPNNIRGGGVGVLLLRVHLLLRKQQF